MAPSREPWCVPARADPHEGEAPIPFISRVLRLSLCAQLLCACTDDDSPAPSSCVVDADCDDGNPCTGAETCDGGTCRAAEAVHCDDPEQICVVSGEEASCERLCPLPEAPMLDVLRDDEVVSFSVVGEAELAIGDGERSWQPLTSVDLDGQVGALRITARVDDADCDPDEPDHWFDHTYLVAGSYPHPEVPGAAPSVPVDDPRIRGWATAVVDYVPGDEVDEAWRDAEGALGPAEGDGLAVLSLGRGGQATLRIEPPATDGPGPDLAVFENGFSAGFLELARVEVSSDGRTFVPFAGVSRTPGPIGAFEPVEPAHVHGFAGAWQAGEGTPFDLELLRHHPLVRAGQVDLNRIHFVRLVDIVGDGSDLDAFGRPIHDPFPTVGSAGFDLDGVAVLGTP